MSSPTRLTRPASSSSTTNLHPSRWSPLRQPVSSSNEQDLVSVVPVLLVDGTEQQSCPPAKASPVVCGVSPAPSYALLNSDSWAADTAARRGTLKTNELIVTPAKRAAREARDALNGSRSFARQVVASPTQAPGVVPRSVSGGPNGGAAAPSDAVVHIPSNAEDLNSAVPVAITRPMSHEQRVITVLETELHQQRIQNAALAEELERLRAQVGATTSPVEHAAAAASSLRTSTGSPSRSRGGLTPSQNLDNRRPVEFKPGCSPRRHSIHFENSAPVKETKARSNSQHSSPHRRSSKRHSIGSVSEAPPKPENAAISHTERRRRPSSRHLEDKGSQSSERAARPECQHVAISLAAILAQRPAPQFARTMNVQWEGDRGFESRFLVVLGSVLYQFRRLDESLTRARFLPLVGMTVTQLVPAVDDDTAGVLEWKSQVNSQRGVLFYVLTIDKKENDSWLAALIAAGCTRLEDKPSSQPNLLKK